LVAATLLLAGATFGADNGGDLSLQKVTDQIHAVVGPFGNRTPENFGNEERVVFSGDVVFVGRMLGVLPYSSSVHWIEAFEAMAALEPVTVVPGHGPATDLATARADTLDYLVFLRETVEAFMEGGGDITRIGTLDQSRFAYLEDYETLKGRNAQQVFEEMEWD